MARYANMMDDSMEEHVLEGDSGLHETIYRATHNLALGQVGKAIVAMLRQHFWTEAKEFNRYWGNPEEHRDLVAAIAERDSESAARIANKLLDVNRERSKLQQNGKDFKEE
jgi:DNA-binding FadR family transcriptional regulator